MLISPPSWLLGQPLAPKSIFFPWLPPPQLPLSSISPLTHVLFCSALRHYRFLAPSANGAALDILDELRGKFSIIQPRGLFWGFFVTSREMEKRRVQAHKGWDALQKEGGWRLIQTSGVFQKISEPQRSPRNELALESAGSAFS